MALSSDDQLREAEAQNQLADMEKKVKALEDALLSAQQDVGDQVDVRVVELQGLHVHSGRTINRNPCTAKTVDIL